MIHHFKRFVRSMAESGLEPVISYSNNRFEKFGSKYKFKDILLVFSFSEPVEELFIQDPFSSDFGMDLITYKVYFNKTYF